MDLFENAAGAVLDALIELVAVACLVAGVVPVLHGTAGGGRFVPLALVGIALVALEVSRALRTAYVVGAGPTYRMQVATTSAPFFVADAVLLAAGVAWLGHTVLASPGPAARTNLALDLGAPAIALVVAGGLLGTRSWARRHDDESDEGFPADLAGAVLDFFLEAAGLSLVAYGGLPASAAGAALLVLVVVRVVRGGYVLGKGELPITVSTVSAPYFASDALLLGFGFGHWTAEALVAVVLAVRIVARLRRRAR